MIPPALLSPALGAAALAAAAGAAWGWLVLVHDPDVRAEYKAALDAQVAEQRIEDQKRAIAAMADAEMEQRQALAATVTIRERIVRVPVTTACIDVPSIAAALDGLRDATSGRGAAGGAAIPVGVPGSPTGAAAGRR